MCVYIGVHTHTHAVFVTQKVKNILNIGSFPHPPHMRTTGRRPRCVTAGYAAHTEAGAAPRNSALQAAAASADVCARRLFGTTRTRHDAANATG